MLRHLVEEGLVAEREGALRRVGDESLAGRIPEGLRDVIGKRLSRLDEKTNQVLSIAAVIGREFRLDVLQTVLAASPVILREQGPGAGSGSGPKNLEGGLEEEIDRALEQAQDRAIVETRSALGALGFRFTHAFFRQTLYEEMFASRRLRLHQQVARALEEVYDRRVEEHASELAEHFAQSTDPADLRRALHYSEVAARRAMAVFAYGEAARHLDSALKLQEVLDPDDAAKRCDLLIALAEALLPTEEPGRVAQTVAPEAFALAESMGDSHRGARVAIQALEAITRASTEAYGATVFGEWPQRADRLAAAGTIERVYADVYLGRQGLAALRRTEAHGYLRRAVELAEELKDPAAYHAAASWALQFLNAARDRPLLASLAEGVLKRPRDRVRYQDLAVSLRFGGDILLEQGDREAAETLWSDLDDLARHTRDASIALRARAPQALIAFLEGRVEDTAAICHDLRSEGVGFAGYNPETFYLLPRSLVYLGRTEAAISFGESFGTNRAMGAALACWLAHGGRTEEVKRLRADFGSLASHDDESAVQILVHLLEAAILTADIETVRELAPRLSPFAGLSCVRQTLGSYGRLLGAAARLLGETDQAQGYYRQAIEAAKKIRFRPEIALTRLELAELLLEEAISYQPSAVSAPPPEAVGEDRGGLIADKLTADRSMADQLKAEGLAHLDFAIAELREMKMQPALERALRHKGLLHA